MALTCASSVTSQATTWAARPSARTSSATPSSASVSRAVSTISAPSRANVVVMAAPMPFAAPVTIAFLPSTFTARIPWLPLLSVYRDVVLGVP